MIASNFSLIAAVDIGSPMAGKLGWATLPEGKLGKDMDELAYEISSALLKGSVALGFETPLWVPKRQDPMKLTKARSGEGSRSWSAGAGAGVLATGLVTIPYILSRIKELSPNAVASLDFNNPPTQPGDLFLWEAFVSGQAKGVSHEDDALIAARAFQKAQHNLPSQQMITPESSFNLLGAMLLRTGWSTDLNLLKQEMLVIKG